MGRAGDGLGVGGASGCSWAWGLPGSPHQSRLGCLPAGTAQGSSDGDRPGGLCCPDPTCALAWILWKAMPGFPAHLLLRCAEDPSWAHADLGLNLDLCLLTL